MSVHVSNCKVTCYRHEEDLLVVPEGRLRLENCEALKTLLRGALLLRPVRLALLMSRLTEIDSAGLGVLVGLHMTSRKNKCELLLLSPTAQHVNLLKMTRLDQVIRIVGGIEAEDLRRHIEKPEHEIELPAVDPT
jgi:anti-anti-sigma factor